MATAPKPPKPGSAEQFARFVETARKLECDDDKERFEERIGKIAEAKPSSVTRRKPAQTE